jgi:hypothetical protein
LEKAKIFCFSCFLLLLLSSCNWFTPHEFVSVNVHNSHPETVIVDTGLTLFTAEVPPDSSRTVQIVKGAWVSATGKFSGTVYSSRRFYSDGDWYI